MEALAGPFYVAAVLLVVSGMAKLSSPKGTTGALRSIRIPAPAWSGRVIGAAEILVGAGALGRGGRFATVAVAGLYAGFAAFLAVAFATGGKVSSCGCFGSEEIPPSWLHLVLVSGMAAIAGAISSDPPAGVVATLTGQPVFGLPFVAFVALGVWLSYLVLTELPRLIPAGAK